MPARYWRINVTATANGSLVSLAEIEMRATVGGADQTSTGNTIFSGSPTSAASNAFDDDDTTDWTIFAIPSWIGQDFGAGNDTTVVQISMTAAQNDQIAPEDFDVQYSDNGSTWTTSDSYTGISWSSEETKTFSVTDPTSNDGTGTGTNPAQTATGEGTNSGGAFQGEGKRFVRRQDAARGSTVNNATADITYDTAVFSENIYSYSSPEVTVDETGPYLCIFDLGQVALSSDRAVGTLMPAIDSVQQTRFRASHRYLRNAGGALEGASIGHAILDLTASEAVKIRNPSTLAPTDANGNYATNSGNGGALQLIRLNDGNFTHVERTVDAAEVGVSQINATRPWIDSSGTWTTITYDSEVKDDDGLYPGTGGDVTLAANKKYLIVWGATPYSTSGARHAYVVRLQIDSVNVQTASSYQRLASLAGPPLSGMYLHETGGTSEVARLQATQETEGGAGTPQIADAYLQVIELPDGAEWIHVDNGTTDSLTTALAGTGLYYDTPLSSTFRADGNSDLSLDSANDAVQNDSGNTLPVLAIGWHRWDRDSGSSGNRKVPWGRFENGGTPVGYGIAGAYSRGSQGSEDTWQAHYVSVATMDLANAADLTFTVNDPASSVNSDMGIYASTNRHFLGLQVLNLNTLEPAAGANGTGTGTNPAQTGSGTGTTLTEGTGTGTQPVQTATGTGTTITDGTGTGTQPAQTATGTGSTVTDGTGTGTQPAQTATGTGTVSQIGSGSSTSPAQTATGTGSTVTEGTGAVSNPAQTATGTGATVTNGTGTGTSPAQTATGTGSTVTDGAGTGTSPAQTATGTGATLTEGTGTGTQPVQTGTGTGSGEQALGTGTGTNPVQTATGQGATVTDGTGTGTVPAQTATGTGQTVTDGTGAVDAPAQTASGTGLVLTEGAGSGSQAVQTGTGTGSGAAADGVGTGTNAAQTATGTGATLTEGAGSGTSPVQTATGTGSTLTEGTGTGTQPGQTATGTGTTEQAIGSGAGTNPVQTATGTGDTLTEGTGTGDQPAQTASGTGATLTEGAGTGDAPAQTASGTGNLLTEGTGTGTNPVQTATGTGSASVSVTVILTGLSATSAVQSATICQGKQCAFLVDVDPTQIGGYASVGPSQSGGYTEVTPSQSPGLSTVTPSSSANWTIVSGG